MGQPPLHVFGMGQVDGAKVDYPGPSQKDLLNRTTCQSKETFLEVGRMDFRRQSLKEDLEVHK